MNDERANTVTIQKDWKALVLEFENLNAPDPTYQFSARTFTERTEDAGIYQDDE